MAERSAVEPNRRAIYLLVNPLGGRLAGNLSFWPNAADRSGYVRFDIDRPRGRFRSGEVASGPGQGVHQSGGLRAPGGPRHSRPRPGPAAGKAASFLGVGAIVVLGLVGGLILSRWMLARLERINRSTTRIMEGELGRRIAIRGNGDEFDDLAQNLNGMLDRIERLLAGMRQVSEDIAHDLRTPLTRMRSRIEVALMGTPDPDEWRGLLEQTLQDADRLIETFNALLAIARAEAGAQQGDWERLDLAEVARDVADLYEPLAEEARSTSSSTPAGRHHSLSSPARVPGDCQCRGQCGEVHARRRHGHDRHLSHPQPTVTITDTGPGIPAELRDHAKQRFVRLDAQRTTPGSGLGLSLVDAVAKLHEAKLTLEDNRPGAQGHARLQGRAAQRVEPTAQAA